MRTESEQLKEQDKLQILIEKYKDKLGNFDLVSVGNAGFILQSRKQKPMAGNDWAFFDYDDTLVATTVVKENRLSQYKIHLEQLGVTLSLEQTKEIMSYTDKFSRWEENEGEGKIYHADYHMVALQWATEIIRNHDNAIDKAIDIIKTKLNTIKLGLETNIQIQEDTPFHIDQNKKLILHGIDKIWSKKIEQIFMSTMINPPQYKETIQGAIEIGKPKDSIHRTNLGVFTYGDPYYQLLKIFELMQQYPDLAISQIWLTRRSKGDFIAQATQTKATQHLEQNYISSNLEEYEGEGMAHGFGYVLSQANHNIIMLDDDPKQLSSILSSNEVLKKNTGAQFIVVRSIRPNTKAQHREWQVNNSYGELDFTSKTFLPSDIYTVILVNRFIAMRSNLGEDHQNTINLQNQLNQRGVTEI